MPSARKPNRSHEDYLTVRELAIAVDRSEQWIRQRILDGTISRVTRIGARGTRIDPSERTRLLKGSAR